MKPAAAFLLPVRKTIQSDPEVLAANRHYGAVSATVEVAKDVPPLPEYSEVGEFMVRRVHQALTGELEVKEALDLAADEVREHLKKRGYDLK
jgi:maltose-binding protein MalE